MKINFAILLLVFLSTVVRAQQSPNSESSDSTNIYYAALKKYFGDDKKKAKVLIEQNDFLFPFLKYQFDTTGFEFVDRTRIIAKAKKQGSLTVYNILPMRISKSNELYISVIHFSVQYKKHKLEFVNNGGGRIYFEYDCSKKLYHYQRVDNISL